MTAPRGRALHWGVAVVSAALLMAELLAMRQWKVGLGMESAFVMIPVALMGNAVGSVMAFFVARRWPARAALAVLVGSVVFAVLAPSQFILLGLYGFADVAAVGSRMRTEGAAWALLQQSAVLAVSTFTASGFVTTMAFQAAQERTVSLYAAVLAGSAAGAASIVPLMDALGGPGAVTVMACVAVVAVPLFHVVLGPAPLRLAATCLAAVAVMLGLSIQLPAWSRVHVFNGTPAFAGSNAIAQIEAWETTKKRVGRDTSDFHSPRSHTVSVYRVSVDERSTSTRIVVYDEVDDVDSLQHDVGHSIFRLRRPQDVLICGSGGGMDVLQALVAGVPRVTAVEINGVTVAASRHVGSRVYDDPRVDLYVQDGRRFARQRPDVRWDLILLPHVKGYGSAGFGYSIVKDYMLTAEALWLFLTRLGPRGVLAVRDADSTLVWHLDTLLLALGQHEVLDSRRLLRIDGVHDCIVAYSPLPFTDAEIAEVEASLPRDFHVSRLTPAELEKRREKRFATVDDWPFVVRLQSSDLESASATTYLIWSYRGTVDYIVGVGLLLCLVPWAFVRPPKGQRAVAILMVTWFVLIGAGFVLTELALIDLFSPLIGHPMISTCAVITALLLAAGGGSMALGRGPSAGCPRTAFVAAFPAMAALLAMPLLVTNLAQSFAGGLAMCIIVSGLLLAIPGIFMGALFPNGLRIAALQSPLWVPWMWTANGVGAVFGGLPFRYMSYMLGFTRTLWIAIALYLVAALCMLLVMRLLRGRAEVAPQVGG